MCGLQRHLATARTQQMCGCAHMMRCAQESVDDPASESLMVVLLSCVPPLRMQQHHNVMVSADTSSTAATTPTIRSVRCSCAPRPVSAPVNCTNRLRVGVQVAGEPLGTNPYSHSVHVEPASRDDFSGRLVDGSCSCSVSCIANSPWCPMLHEHSVESD